MRQRMWVAVVGVVVVAVYAALMATQALVLDPLAAVPGQSLAEIHARLLEAGMDVRGDITSVIISAGFGVVLALAAAVLGIRRRMSALVMAVIFLAILALGAFVTFGSGFALGMDIADTYAVGGGAHTIWAGVLYMTSLTAFLSILAIGAATILQLRSSTVMCASETNVAS
ncbi:hypothetical protein [Leifsonia sp. A12D58]|uniref:hypothetical protein n=1 Tax=Leifsonia sp. A12D58 TaxID=3397674 RepID=UPI0039E12AF0